MSGSLLLHPKSQQAIDKFIRRPAGAILITGPPGSGKTAAAKLLAGSLLSIDSGKLNEYPYFMHIQRPEGKQEIPIDSIRRVIRELGLKPVVGGQRTAKRVVLIEDSGALSHEAQNALLKSIEEPDNGTVFILTADSVSKLLPTIVSRTQILPIAAVAADEARQFFRGEHSSAAIDSAWQLSQGAPGLLSALLSEDSSHPLKRAVDDAKRFLQQDRYHRAIYLDGLSSDKAGFLTFLEALSRILTAVQRSAVAAGDQRQTRRVTAARRMVNKDVKSLEANASVRLVALDLALNLPL